tara:strand:- start:1 stop:171 length:171 start_codon:yes stop_codon:yes gene_type:complete
MKDLKIGTINGILAALAVMVPITLTGHYVAIIPAVAIFICGAVFGICVLIFFKGEE